jgi:hypothetical protein
MSPQSMALEQRMDQFYAWAQQLQSEMRKLHAAHTKIALLESEVQNLNQRVGFLEGILQNHFNFIAPKIETLPSAFKSDEDLLTRLQKLKGGV